MKEIGFFPGCSVFGGGIELGLSIRALSLAAGVTLREIADWNCCGATAAHNLNHELAVALPYRILSLAEQQGLTEVLAPCAACFSRLKGTNVRLEHSDKLPERMRQITLRQYAGKVRVVNIAEYVNLLLEGGLAEKLATPFDGLKVAVYYGCLLSRGEGIVEGEDAEHPGSLEAAVRAAGCESVEWNFANECCGGGFSMSKTAAVVGLSDAILTDAKASGAEAVVVGCPMCHSNLDMRQRTINEAGKGPHQMPVVYVSELLCLAAGMEPQAVGLERHFTDAMGLATRRGRAGAEPAMSAAAAPADKPVSPAAEKRST